MKNYWNVKPKWLLKQKPIEVKTINVVKHRKPLPRNPDKNLSYPKARTKFGTSLSPLGNWDKDKHINMFDCRPFNPLRHKVPEELKDHPVYSYAKPKKTTFAKVFADAERFLPKQFKGPSENEYSKILSNALLKRLHTGDVIPLKDVVGTYVIPPERVPSAKAHTKMLHDYINEYLMSVYPDRVFRFNYSNPAYVDVEIYTKDERTGKDIVKIVKNRKLGSYLVNAPSQVKDLNTLYTTNKGVTIVITDYPVDVLRKATGVGWKTCETFPEHITSKTGSWTGPFSDVANRNALAFFYLGDREPGKDKPTARVMLRWGECEGKVDLTMEKRIYPTTLSDFYLNFVREILLNKGYGKHKIRTPYPYTGYADVLFTKAGSVTDKHITYDPITDWEFKEPEGATEKDIIRVKEGIISRRKLPLPLESQFAKPSEVESIREQLAQRIPQKEPVKRTGIRRATIAHLARDPSVKVRKALIEYQPVIEDSSLQRLASGSPLTVQKKILERKGISEKIVRQLSENPELYVEIAKRSDAPRDILKKITFMSGSSHNLLNAKKEIAKRPNLPQDWIVALSETGDTNVLRELAKHNQKFPEPVIKKMLEQDSSDIEQALALNPFLPAWAAQKLLVSPDWEVQRNIILTYGLPEKLLIYLTKEELGVRNAIAQTPILTPKVFRILSTDKSQDIRNILSRRSDITPEVAEYFSNSTSETLLYNLAKNPLTKLSIKQKKEVLEKIVATGNTRLIRQVEGRKDFER